MLSRAASQIINAYERKIPPDWKSGDYGEQVSGYVMQILTELLRSTPPNEFIDPAVNLLTKRWLDELDLRCTHWESFYPQYMSWDRQHQWLRSAIQIAEAFKWIKRRVPQKDVGHVSRYWAMLTKCIHLLPTAEIGKHFAAIHGLAIWLSEAQGGGKLQHNLQQLLKSTVEQHTGLHTDRRPLCLMVVAAGDAILLERDPMVSPHDAISVFAQLLRANMAEWCCQPIHRRSFSAKFLSRLGLTHRPEPNLLVDELLNLSNISELAGDKHAVMHAIVRRIQHAAVVFPRPNPNLLHICQQFGGLSRASTPKAIPERAGFALAGIATLHGTTPDEVSLGVAAIGQDYFRKLFRTLRNRKTDLPKVIDGMRECLKELRVSHEVAEEAAQKTRRAYM